MQRTYSNPKFHYRPDIDGLRALAVIPVMLFHLGLGCPGGYVGVDVFFVISGYLITSIILKEQSAGTFSMLQFWERRIRRLLPALVTVVFFTIIAASFVLYPSQFRPFGKEVIAQATMLSNFYFWQQDGYFAPLSEHQPLLHTWSLAVEEQFYFLFPSLLLLLKKCRCSFLGIAFISIGSFAWSLYSLTHYPSATFYLLPARAWELLLGALLAMSVIRWNPPAILREIASCLGLLSILFPILFYTSSTPFPGLAALLPCLGAALILVANKRNDDQGYQPFGSRILSLPPFVWIGKISYSLYLWHWPLIVFINYASITEPSPILKAGVGCASIILAWLSWKFIEAPFRKTPTQTSHRKAFKAFGLTTSVLILIGAIVYKTNGVPSRFSQETLGYAMTENLRKNFKDSLPEIIDQNQLSLLTSDQADTKKLPILIWGDSHARSMAPLFQNLCKQYHANIYIAHQSGTPPLLEITSPPALTDPTSNDTVFKLIQSQQIKHVILIARWELHALGDRRNNTPSTLTCPSAPDAPPLQVFTDGLHRTVKRLKDAGISVWIVKQVPLQKIYPPRLLANAYRYGYTQVEYLEIMGLKVEQHLQWQYPINTIIDNLSAPNIHIIDPLPHLANEQGFCMMEADGHSLYYDDNHLSKYGALRLKPLFEPLFKQLTSSPNDSPQ